MVIQWYHAAGAWLETLTSATNLLSSNPAHQTLEEMIHPLLIAHTFWPFDVDFAVKHLFDLFRDVLPKVTEFNVEYGFALTSG